MNSMKKIWIYTAIIAILLFSDPVSGHCEKTVSSMKAFLMSFAVPGLGQYYFGSPGYAKFFLATELAIWSGYYYNYTMKDARAQDYYSYAALHAGVNPTGFGTSYLNAIGAYNSSFEHNGYKQQKSAEPVLYSGDMNWNWDSEENRLHFRNLRERELDNENNLKYCIAGAVLNHFLAGLHASKLSRKPERRAHAFTVNVLDGGLAATYRRSF